MADKRYRAAVIGHTGQGDYGHGIDTVYLGMPEVEIAAVADPDAEGRAKAAARLGVCDSFADYREMLAKVRPDIVSICPRWIGGHREMLLASVEHGAKAIYSEKPFARTLAEADEMIAALKRGGVYCAVAHQNRVIPYLEHVRHLIAQGAIGKVRRIRGKGKDDSRGGAQDLIVLGTHVLDEMRAIAGDPLWAFGHLRTEDRETIAADVREAPEQLGRIAGDNLSGYFAFPNGVAGTFDSYVSKGSGRHMGIWIEGTEGTMTFHGGFAKQVHLCRTPQWTPEVGAAAWERITLSTWDNGPDGKPRADEDLLRLANQAMVRGLIHCIEHGGRHPSSAEDARWAMEMYFAIPESHRTGARVALPLKARTNPWTALGA
jgi:predicted dehydrogenase